MPSTQPKDEDKEQAASTVNASVDHTLAAQQAAQAAAQSLTDSAVIEPGKKGDAPTQVPAPDGPARYIPPIAPANAPQPETYQEHEQVAGVDVPDGQPSFARTIPYNEAQATPEQRGERPGSFYTTLQEAYDRAQGTYKEPKPGK